MKTQYLTVLTLFSIQLACAQFTFIPDENFEARLIDLGIDTDNTINGQVATADIINVIELFLDGYDITDVTGVEDFESLELLFAGSCQLEDVDFSDLQNLSLVGLEFNQLVNIDLSNNPNLTGIGLAHNNLTTIDFSNNPLLNFVYLGNTDITYFPQNNIMYLDFSAHPLMDLLYVQNLGLEELNLKNGHNEDIRVVDARGNPALRCIQVDDAIAATNGEGSYAGWDVDPGVIFSENCLLSVNEENIIPISFYPNPVTDKLFVRAISVEILEIKIFDLVGKQVFITNNLNSGFIDIGSLAIGTYLLKMKTTNGNYSEKIIKQ